ncbi:YbbR-like domain-containing protein [Maribacter algarum]|uniref:YbbR-like domain-containing protein n=1 Tax=Maribacter algarum (ex Zhang et al. 2020) TaxID=2578118 RepID=A0A5S3PQD5_9FLAO|nr:YbbR-like domain-containing protein [Maribacter algarum]TMM56912.1 YbbR-like domain-containing protein [Maribacter algarum]
MIQKIRNSLKKRKVKVFLVFLFCSTSAWFISNLSESYISNTTFELEYANAKEDLMLVNSSQDKINVKLEAVGFQFLGFNFKKKNIAIDLSAVAKEGRQYYLSYQNYRAQIEKQLPSSMRLIDIEKDTLFFDFQEVISKEVPVKPQLNLSLEQNYLLDGKLKVTPATVIIKGPRNEIDTIANVKSSKINLIDLTSDFTRKATVIVPVGLRFSTFSETSITVSGKVSRFSEKMITIKVKVLNLPTGTSVKMFPDKVNVLCKGTIGALKDLEPSDFTVIADFDKKKNSKSKRIALRLNKIPEQLSSAILQEMEVEYILKRE